MDGNGDTMPLFHDEAISCWHPYPIMARPKPPVLASASTPQLADQDAARAQTITVHTRMQDFYTIWLNGRLVTRFIHLTKKYPRIDMMGKEGFMDTVAKDSESQ
jgi:hypothetical protein